MANVTAYPPDRRMEEEQSFGKGLQQVPEKIGAADMGQLMCQDNFEFFRAERCCGGNRQQHQSAKGADGHRARDRA